MIFLKINHKFFNKLRTFTTIHGTCYLLLFILKYLLDHTYFDYHSYLISLKVNIQIFLYNIECSKKKKMTPGCHILITQEMAKSLKHRRSSVVCRNRCGEEHLSNAFGLYYRKNYLACTLHFSNSDYQLMLTDSTKNVQHEYVPSIGLRNILIILYVMV